MIPSGPLTPSPQPPTPPSTASVPLKPQGRRATPRKQKDVWPLIFPRAWLCFPPGPYRRRGEVTIDRLFFLAMPFGMGDLSSLTRDRTRLPCVGSAES